MLLLLFNSSSHVENVFLFLLQNRNRAACLGKNSSGMLLRSRYGGLTGSIRPSHALHAKSVQQRSYERQQVVHARGRRSATMDEAEDVPEEDTPPQQQVIKSARRGMHERRNSRINRTAQQLVSPYQTLRDMNIVTADENG